MILNSRLWAAIEDVYNDSLREMGLRLAWTACYGVLDVSFQSSALVYHTAL